LVRETRFETLLVDFGLGPDERFGIDVVVINEGIDVLSELFDGGEGLVGQGLILENLEPYLHLIEP
jgi:hypothetical protein